MATLWGHDNFCNMITLLWSWLAERREEWRLQRKLLCCLRFSLRSSRIPELSWSNTDQWSSFRWKWRKGVKWWGGNGYPFALATGSHTTTRLLAIIFYSFIIKRASGNVAPSIATIDSWKALLRAFVLQRIAIIIREKMDKRRIVGDEVAYQPALVAGTL